jgi:AcrR family transcriptional regulator
VPEPLSTRARLLAATRELLVTGSGALPGVGEVAARAGVSRLTVYHHFGSHAGLLSALEADVTRPRAELVGGAPVDRLRGAIAAACAHWASDPTLFRRLPGRAEAFDGAAVHTLAVTLAEADRLRPGCSLREAEDVIAVALSFGAFDRLHAGGRRSPTAVAEILFRIASTVLA